MTNDKTAPQGASLPELPSTPTGSSMSDLQLTVEVDIEHDGDPRPYPSPPLSDLPPSPPLSDLPPSPPLSESPEKDRRQSTSSNIGNGVDVSDNPRMYECLSDEEIEENYLGNIPPHHRRRHGVVNCPSPISSDGADSGQTSPEEHVEDEGPEYGLRRSKLAKPNSRRNGVYPKRVRMSVDEPHPEEIRGEREGRRGSTESNDTGASYSNALAAHVRKDSIAIGLDKLNGFPFRKKSLLGFMNLPLPSKVKFQSKNGFLPEHQTKKELLLHYRVHIFVAVIFVITVSFVSAAWYFHDKQVEDLATTQKIFFDPRSRVLTLRDQVTGDDLTGHLAQDLPKWQLPLHCPISEKGDPNAKECKWKKNAILRIGYFKEGLIQCYNISWEYRNKNHVPFDCFDLGSAFWYGSSNMTNDMLPITGKFSFDPNVYRLKGNGVLSNVLEYYWLSSQAEAIVVDSNDPLHISWNDTVPGKVCLISNYTEPFYSYTQSLLPHLNYTVCNGVDMVETHAFMRKYFLSPSGPPLPSGNVLTHPHYSVQARDYDRDVTETEVMAMTSEIADKDLNCSTLEIDGNWQKTLGDLDLDQEKFANITAMLDSISASKCKMSLEITPFFHFSSVNFKEGVERELFVMDAGGVVPGLTTLGEDFAGVLDVSNPAAKAWFTGKVNNLVSKYQTSAFRFSYGTKAWMPYKPHFEHNDLTPNKIRRLYTEMVTSISQNVVFEQTSQSQHVGELISVRTSIKTSGEKTCLTNTLARALTLGLLGYPFILSDGFDLYDAVTHSTSGMPSMDLYIRWMQLSAFFPAVKYSIPPWSYGSACVQVAKNMSHIHQTHVVPIINNLADDIKKGLPIMRPVWWMDSNNVTAHRVADEFLVGNKLLVAPVVCEGTTTRGIFFPKGIWSDHNNGGRVLVGPKYIENYTVGQFQIPYFTRMQQYP
ncbi:myogenesis-regulating glycosidase-like isoform X1 [Haliotis rufescens]|uniref:myogenesis-regulating glycosidase-like isoform X1 n=1 Tax=Haliotis rufescens TaxID=6454 RepID=UPI00201EA1DD|nr:myogenesis-regulating glycosidase-like isoform X1 [Haliotis rufescens]XP_046357782.2 myogenesis-regulating glycosidase-like isoform X1 [Haliotis rufescens]